MVSPVMVELRASIGEFQAKMAEARAEMAQVSKAGAGHFETLATVGRGALLGIAAGAAGIGVASLKMAGDFQQSTSVLQTAAGETTSGLKVVRQGILDIARSTGTTWQNLTEGMYQVEKAGYRGADGLKVLRAAAQGAREENASLSSVTNAMTSVMASYHLRASDSVRVMNALKTAAGEGKMTMEEMAGALSTVLPVASANRISLAQVAGAMATLTQHGTSAHEATQELSATIRALAAPNKVAAAEMQQLGLDSQNVASNLGPRGLTGTFELLTRTVAEHTQGGMVALGLFKRSASATADLRLMMEQMSPAARQLAADLMNNTISLKDYRKQAQELDPHQTSMARQFATLSARANGFSDAVRRGDPAAQTMSDALKKMTGGAIGLNTILQLSGESADGFRDRVTKIDESFNNASKDVEGWGQTQKLFNVQMDRLKQSVEAALITIGTRLIPVVSSAIDWMTRHRTAVTVLASAIGVVLTAAIAAFIGKMGLAAAQSAASFARMTASGAAWVAQQLAAFATVLARIAVVAARYAALAVTQAASWARAGAAAVAGAAVQVASWVAVAAAATAAFVAENVATLGIVAAIGVLVAAAIYLYKHWDQVWGFIKRITAEAIGFVRGHLVQVAAALGPVGLAALALYRHWGQVWGFIRSVTAEAVGFVRGHMGALAAALGPVGVAAQALYRSWSSVWHGITSVISGAWSVISGIIGAIRSAVSSVTGAVSGLSSTISSVASAASTVGSIASTVGRAASSVGNALIGRRAAGGPVTAGMPYIVGEREPELFVPSQSGRILNQQQMRDAGMGGDTHITVYAQTSSPAEVAQEIAWAMKTAA